MAGDEGRPPVELQPGDALIVVDIQNDFCPGGALAVNEGDQVVPVLNRWIKWFAEAGLPVVYTQDWHPPDHVSFAARQGPWPPHCVQDTPGAQFHPDLIVRGAIFRKGYRSGEEAYSGFGGNLQTEAPLTDSPGLAQWLREQGVKRVFVGGLATDYCVKATTLDALAADFQAFVIAAGSRPVEVEAGDGQRALTAMEEAGAEILP